MDDENASEHASRNPDNLVVWAPSGWYVQALRGIYRDFSARQAQQFLKRLASSGRFRESRTSAQRGYLWIGARVDPEDSPPPLHIEYRPDIPGSRRRTK